MLIKRRKGSSSPKQISYRSVLGLREYTIAFDITEQTTGDIHEFSWAEATFPLGELRYDSLVSAIVKSRYSDDKMFALINNHSLDDGDKEHEEEWNKMQSWRNEAKRIAKEVLEEIPSN